MCIPLQKRAIALRKFDSHAHIFPDRIATKATEGIENFYSMPTRHVGDLTTLIRLSDEAGVEKIVAQSVATTPAQVAHINEFILEAHRRYPDRIVPFAALHPDLRDMQAGIDQIVRAGFYGVKVHPDFQEFRLDEPRALRMFSMLAGRLPVLVHTGDQRFDFSGPRRMAHALDEVPNLTVICAHLGGWSEFEDAVRLLAGRKNLYVDTSSAIYALHPGRCVEIIRAFGTDRVLFGTDFPMWTPAEETARFDALPLDEAEREKIYFRNAAELLGIE